MNPSNKIKIGSSKIPNAGRGVFATRNIRKGELIERCPAIPFSIDDPANADGSLLLRYFFYFGSGKNVKKGLAVLFGYGSLYNHSYEPNAKYIRRPSRKIMDFVAIRNIKKGQEITTNYNLGDPNDKNVPYGDHGIPSYRNSHEKMKMGGNIKDK